MDTPNPAQKTLPTSFRNLFWSYDFSMINRFANQKEIILQTVNYGTWKQWTWIARAYGKDVVARTLSSLPESAFRPQALRLARVVFDVPTNTYARRGVN